MAGGFPDCMAVGCCMCFELPVSLVLSAKTKRPCGSNGFANGWYANGRSLCDCTGAAVGFSKGGEEEKKNALSYQSGVTAHYRQA